MINNKINPKQTIGGAKVAAQCYSIVNVTRAEPGDTRAQMWSKGQGQTERGRRLGDQNKEKNVQISSIYNKIEKCETKQ
jgi:hypothetical protein